MKSFDSRNIFRRSRNWIVAVAALCAAGFLAVAPSCADEDEHKATSITDKKAAVPLKRIIGKIRRDYGGRLLEIELEKERIGGVYVLVYEAKILTPEGDVLKLLYNARSMKLLKLKGHYKKRRKRRHDDDEDDDRDDD